MGNINSSYENALAGVVALGYMDCSLVDLARGIKFFVEQEARKPNGDTHLIAVLQRAACAAWELSKNWAGSLDELSPGQRETLAGWLHQDHADQSLKLQFTRSALIILDTATGEQRYGYVYIVTGAPDAVVLKTAPVGKEVRHNGAGGTLVMFFDTAAARDDEMNAHDRRLREYMK